ncbi:hypothetical protein ACFQX6_03745 [Streptosporangium lutulentum]
MGFRNPFRMSVDKPTGIVYLGDYGPDAAAPTRAAAPAARSNSTGSPPRATTAGRTAPAPTPPPRPITNTPSLRPVRGQVRLRAARPTTPSATPA